jgi:Fe-S oxidoreductase
VAYFVQCVTDRFAPEQAAAAVRVLRACGAKVVVPEGQHCCGLPALDAGDRASARAMARQTIAVLEAAGADWIVTAAASCAVALVHDYGELFRDDAAWRRRAEALAARTLDLVSFLEQVAKPPAGALARPVGGDRYTYHSFCHSTNVLGIAASAPRLLREVCGLEVSDLPEGEVCCGFGGSTSMDHPEVARAIVTRKLDNVAQTGATVLVTDNPGCLLHLRGAADARGLRLRVAHVAEILAEGLRNDG